MPPNVSERRRSYAHVPVPLILHARATPRRWGLGRLSRGTSDARPNYHCTMPNEYASPLQLCTPSSAGITWFQRNCNQCSAIAKSHTASSSLLHLVVQGSCCELDSKIGNAAWGNMLVGMLLSTTQFESLSLKSRIAQQSRAHHPCPPINEPPRSHKGSRQHNMG